MKIYRDFWPVFTTQSEAMIIFEEASILRRFYYYCSAKLYSSIPWTKLLVNEKWESTLSFL